MEAKSRPRCFKRGLGATEVIMKTQAFSSCEMGSRERSSWKEGT